MAIKLGKYNVCVLDLLTDSRTGRLSASKLWLHIGNSIMSYVMITHEAVDWELMTAFGGIVGGSYVAILFFKLRWGHQGGAVHTGDTGVMLDAPRVGYDHAGGSASGESCGDFASPKTAVRGSRKKARRGNK